MKKVLSLVLALMMVFSLASVVMAEGEVDTSVSGDLSYWSCFSGDSMTWDQWRVEEFKKMYPNVNIDMQSVPESAGMKNGKLMAAIAGGTAPDVLVADDYITSYGFAAQGAFAPWGPYMDVVGLNLDDFMPGFETLLNQNGETYLLPQDSNVIFIYMNDDMFIEAGLDPKTDYPKNIEELDALAEKLTKLDENGNVIQFGYIPWLDSGDDATFWPFMFGAELYNPETNQLELTDPKVVAAFEWQNTYAQKYSAEKMRSFTPTGGGGGLFSPDHPFFNQRVAMTMVGNWATNAIKIYAPQVNYSVCAIPVPDGGRVNSTPLGSNVFAMPATVKNPELAALWFAFCQRPEINGNNFDVWRSIPCIDSIFDEVSWTKSGDPIYALEREIANSPMSGHPALCTVSAQLSADMKSLRDNVIYNDLDPTPLLQELQDKLQPELG
ncbi:extracellular solute-binding protein [Eubacteriales bacterium OttesenSCG-928-N13]|nr:extracellular solute-binding protein [Eubacteriales bacterium OttesenSCG-928-N13]